MQNNHVVQIFATDGADQPLDVGIRIGRLIRRLHHADPRLAHLRTNGRTPLRITIADDHAVADEQAVIGRGQRPAHLTHEHVIGKGVEPRIWTRRDARSITNTV